jgi:predicted transcriptional regulator
MEGPKTSNQIRDIIDMTREHTGRLMKLLFTRGLVVRNDQNKPYVYEVTEAGRRYVANSS